MTKCPECGSTIAPDERFCGNCGALLPGPPPETSEDAPAPPEDLTLSGEPLAPEQPEEIAMPEPESPDLTVLTAEEIEEATPAPARTNRTVWIVVAIVAAVLLLCCCALIILTVLGVLPFVRESSWEISALVSRVTASAL